MQRCSLMDAFVSGDIDAAKVVTLVCFGGLLGADAQVEFSSSVSHVVKPR